ncbi:2652_t:CDS:2 [Cetraspora pellucida]|uniref:2652_t:CDS:1 n=1 Tax=Cetraspora pellucida TaxID=1433469 RepID=A0A9N9A2V1_9GLOM|nr:2652_t:CDS:2 [Cetraspora pellucida]
MDFSPGQEKEIQLITDYFFPLRNDVYQLLEKARREKIIITNSQASLLIHISSKKNPPPEFFQLNLTELLMVAEIRFSPKLKKDMMTGNFCSLYLENTQLKQELLSSFQERVVATEELEEKYNNLELEYHLKQKLQTSQEEKNENLELFVNLQSKGRELKQLKNAAKSKLENNTLLKNLLRNQEFLTTYRTENSDPKTLGLLENELQKLKKQL